MALLALMLAVVASAQTPKPLANPNFKLTAGASVYASERQPDGGLILIGNFTAIQGVPRAGIARLRPDGSVDATWGPDHYQPYTFGYNEQPLLAVDASGAAYVGGEVSYAGGSGTGLFKLSADTGQLVEGWSAGVSATLNFGLAVDQTGLYLSQSAGLHKLSLATGQILWSAAAATAFVLDGHGKIYAAAFAPDSDFRSLVRLSTATGTRDATWQPPVLLASDDRMGVDACGAVYASGRLGIGGAPLQDGIVKVSAGSGNVDPLWDPGAVAGIRAIATDADCSVYIGGSFRSVGGQPAINLAKLSGGDGRVVRTWLAEGACCGVKGLAVEGAGRLRVHGTIQRIGQHARLGLAMLDVATGEPGPAIDAETWARIDAVAADPAGGVIVAGQFSKAGALTRQGLLRLRPNGTLDTQWAPAALVGTQVGAQVAALAVRPDGTVYVGGGLVEVNGEQRGNLVRLVAADGALDSAWNPAANGWVGALAFGADGSVYAGGAFSRIGEQSLPYIARLSGSTGLADPGWNPGADNRVLALSTDAAGNLYAGGAFALFGGQQHMRVAKIAAAGHVLHDWTGESGPATSITQQAGDALYVGGGAYSGGGPLRRLSLSTGALAAGWNSTTRIQAIAFAPTPDGTLYALVQGADYGTYLKRYSADTGLEDPDWNIHVSIGSPIAVDTRGTVYATTDYRSRLIAVSAETIFFDAFDP